MTRPRIGVVGAGSLGYHHVRILKSMDDVDLMGFHDSSPERSDFVAAELGVHSFPSAEALLDRIDALCVAVPTPFHHQVGCAALERGIHCLVEKPIAVTLQEADDMLAAAERGSALLQIGHVERFNRAVRAAAPYLTEARFIQSDRLAPFSPRGSDVAVVLDLMIHDIDLINIFVRAPIHSVSAIGVPVLTPYVDIANARLTFETGAVANITASRVARQRMRKVRVFQHNSYMSLDLAAGTGEYFALREDLDLAEVARAPAEVLSFVEHVPLEAPEGEPLRLELQSFVSGIRGDHPVVVTGKDGREALAVALMIVGEIEGSMPSMRGVGGTVQG